MEKGKKKILGGESLITVPPAHEMILMEQTQSFQAIWLESRHGRRAQLENGERSRDGILSARGLTRCTSERP
jgi:hypothetical protein